MSSSESRPARPEDVDEICAGLPQTELGVSWGRVHPFSTVDHVRGAGALR